jgi:rhodanese-related sulfurtransferase
MNKKILKLVVLAGIIHSFIFCKVAQAVIPPDFIFNIGTQLIQFFSLTIVFFAAVFGTFFQFFKNQYYALKNRKMISILIIVLVISTALISAYFYAVNKQEAEYQKWLAESEKYQAQMDAMDELDIPSVDIIVDPLVETPDDGSAQDENDQLLFGKGDEAVDTSNQRFISSVDLSDSSAQFINEYYKNIALGNFEKAYEMSSQVVGFNTFSNWYTQTSKITLDKLVRIDERKSSIELTLYEGDSLTRYGVLMTLVLNKGVPVKIEKSEVKILFQGVIEKSGIGVVDTRPVDDKTFFQENVGKDLFVTNKAFKDITAIASDDYLVLDARENVEYENGYFPGSVHIRFADLKAGRWLELPQDKFIYVFCWSGIRGKEVAEFLRTKQLSAFYVENGASGWVEFGGKWIGGIKFTEKYTADKYRVVLEAEDVKTKVSEGVVLVDSREPYKFKKWHIPGSFNIPIMYTPTINMKETFAQVPVGSKVITVCDAYVNCFDAKITGVELERLGYTFLGIYNKPWDYAN